MSQFMMLLVEDDPLQREVFADILKGEGFEVVECATAEAAEIVIATSGVEFRADVRQSPAARSSRQFSIPAKAVHGGRSVDRGARGLSGAPGPRSFGERKPKEPSELPWHCSKAGCAEPAKGPAGGSDAQLCRRRFRARDDRSDVDCP